MSKKGITRKKSVAKVINEEISSIQGRTECGKTEGGVEDQTMGRGEKTKERGS
jgi:hypothetical protein